MKHLLALILSLSGLLFCQGYLVASSQMIVEGQTSLPLAYDVDVLAFGLDILTTYAVAGQVAPFHLSAQLSQD